MSHLLQHRMPICQVDYPLDWYQKEFIPYAEEYQALPNREWQTVIKWLESYITPAAKHFGDSLLLLAHYYMGGEIVKLVESFGGIVGDSYQLALKAKHYPEKKVIVESAVHFMAESICLLASPDQQVYITNPKSGCTMEMLAKDFMVKPAFTQLNARYGKDNILPICYMNTSGRVKAMTGEQGGAVCTSANVKQIFAWALAKNKKILFIPDQHMGENVAGWLDIPPTEIAYWPAGTEGAQYQLSQQSCETLDKFDRAKIILFASHCGVHSYYQPDMVQYWQQKGFHVIAHPECRKTVVDIADSYGSTAFIWEQVTQNRARTGKYAIATENHLVKNLKFLCTPLGIEVVNVGEAVLGGYPGIGCGCATMSRNDPPHLAALLDLLRLGKAPDINKVQAGDVVNEFSGERKRLDPAQQSWIITNAQKSMHKMIEIVEDNPFLP